VTRVDRNRWKNVDPRKRILSGALVDAETGCWVWQRQISTSGYGMTSYQGKYMGAHRAVYLLEKGEIPEGLELDHLCRNRACINPEHLEPVTRRENLLRGETRTARRARQTHCKRGHEFTPENTIIDGGTRRCRACKNERDRNYARRCQLCDRRPAAGWAKVGADWYCHGDDDPEPTCYMRAQSDYGRLTIEDVARKVAAL
jgi:hypothetical protein